MGHVWPVRKVVFALKRAGQSRHFVPHLYALANRFQRLILDFCQERQR